MSASPSTPYEFLGGDAGIRAIVDRFYDLMDSVAEAATIRRLHAASLKASREKLYMYLTGWTGGPQLYIERHGHPRLRARHLPFSIGERERDEWLWCMERALGEREIPEELRADLWAKIRGLADHMRNAGV
jgi:hemoglobin